MRENGHICIERERKRKNARACAYTWGPHLPGSHTPVSLLCVCVCVSVCAYVYIKEREKENVCVCCVCACVYAWCPHSVVNHTTAPLPCMRMYVCVWECMCVCVSWVRMCVCVYITERGRRIMCMSVYLWTTTYTSTKKDTKKGTYVHFNYRPYVHAQNLPAWPHIHEKRDTHLPRTNSKKKLGTPWEHCPQTLLARLQSLPCPR